MIISNPPIRAGKVIVHKIAEEAKLHLNQKGFFYAVVQKKQGAESCLKAMKEVYDSVEVIDKDKGYYFYGPYDICVADLLFEAGEYRGIQIYGGVVEDLKIQLKEDNRYLK